MIENLKKLVSTFIKPSGLTYFLIGVFCGLVTIYLFSPDIQSRWVVQFGYACLLVMLVHYFSVKFFYSNEERKRDDMHISNSGLVMRDDYFLVKINSNISNSKKFLGGNHPLC